MAELKLSGPKLRGPNSQGGREAGGGSIRWRLRKVEVSMFKNTIKTAALLAGLGALFMVVGGALGGSSGVVIGLMLGLVFVGGSYWFSDTIAVKAARARPVSEAEQPKLYAIVRDLTHRAQMPMPKVYVSDNAQPNAFATGRTEHHAAAAAPEGLVRVLNEEERRGARAHETSHIRPRHTLITSVAAAVAM